jgi:hypothetical protein
VAGDASVPDDVPRYRGAGLQPAAGQRQLRPDLVSRPVLHCHALHRRSGQEKIPTLPQCSWLKLKPFVRMAEIVCQGGWTKK